MILAIVFAELWAVCQLIVLGSFTRTVRVRTIFMAVAVGLYACAPLAVLAQATWISAAARLSGIPAYQLVKVAAYTADPFIEEILKVLPLAMLLTIPAIRRQCSITDCVLLGGACGAGFGLAEELYRFGQVSTSALFNATFGGWMQPGIAATPTVPSLSTTLHSWLPPGVLPNELLALSLNNYPAINVHLAWSAVGGLAVALMWLRRDWMNRIAGAILLLYVASDHALNNAHAATGFSMGFSQRRNVLAVLPIVALGIAWWFDRRSQRSSDEPVLAAERAASWRVVGTLQVAVSRLPGSLSQLFGFVVAPQSSRWLPIGWTRRNVFRALRQPAVVFRLVLMTPSFLWFVVGGWPSTAAVQQMLTGPVAWKVVIVLALVSQAWLAWSVIVAVRAWPKALRLPIGDDAALGGLRIACGVGTVALGGYALLGTLTGVAADGHPYMFHVVDAFVNLTAAGLMMLATGPIGFGIFGAAAGDFGATLARFAQQDKTGKIGLEDLYKGVDRAAARLKEGNKKLVADAGDTPVLGSLAKASAWMNDQSIDATGGVVKGVVDLAAAAGNTIIHPVDAALESGLGMAEHLPLAPGLNTIVKARHGLWDLANGKENAEYGSSPGELGDNLLMGTHVDPDDKSKRSNADLDFAAGLGGGKEAWSNNPVGAAARTLTNLAPMFLGGEAAGGNKPAPGGPPVPEGIPGAAVDPFGTTASAGPTNPPATTGEVPRAPGTSPLATTVVPGGAVDPFGATVPGGSLSPPATTGEIPPAGPGTSPLATTVVPGGAVDPFGATVPGGPRSPLATTGDFPKAPVDLNKNPALWKQAGTINLPPEFTNADGGFDVEKWRAAGSPDLHITRDPP